MSGDYVIEDGIVTHNTTGIPDADLLVQIKSAEDKAIKIAAIEATVTARNIRSAALGDPFAIAVLTKAEADIAAIRSLP